MNDVVKNILSEYYSYYNFKISYPFLNCEMGFPEDNTSSCNDCCALGREFFELICNLLNENIPEDDNIICKQGSAKGTREIRAANGLNLFDDNQEAIRISIISLFTAQHHKIKHIFRALIVLLKMGLYKQKIDESDKITSDMIKKFFENFDCNTFIDTNLGLMIFQIYNLYIEYMYKKNGIGKECSTCVFEYIIISSKNAHDTLLKY